MKPLRFGRYLLQERLALGGTAEIFRATLMGVEGFEKEVVIKRILPPWSANPDFISMLIDEAKILVRLQDEKIVQVYELGKENNLYYISMEYVKGWDLRYILRSSKEESKPFKTSECIHVISEILKGLHYIHKQTDKHGHSLEIVHRDISPQNILISTEGKIKIADFGIAHARSRSYETSTGVIKGKFSYMSPEQARGEVLNFKTDLFATGILLYEMLSRQKLFQGKRDLEVLDQVRKFEAKKALQNLVIPEPLKLILHKALAAQTFHRYSSAQEFLKDLQEAAIKLAENDGEKLFLQRLQKTPQPEEKKEESLSLSTSYSDPSPTNPIVSREWVSDTSFEITRSLGKEFGAQTDRNPSWTSPKKSKSRKIIYTLILLVFIGFFTLMLSRSQTHKKLLQNETPQFVNSALPLPTQNPESRTLPESSANQNDPEKAESKSISKTTAKPEIQKGLLSVRASPWGKISVSGIANNVEKPLLRSVPYGNYQIRVSYQNNEGKWISVSKSVNISKASTLCTASFHPDGRNSLGCR